jgi:hypothetical protein
MEPHGQALYRAGAWQARGTSYDAIVGLWTTASMFSTESAEAYPPVHKALACQRTCSASRSEDYPFRIHRRRKPCPHAEVHPFAGTLHAGRRFGTQTWFSEKANKCTSKTS